jgi:hypothetical protein
MLAEHAACHQDHVRFLQVADDARQVSAKNRKRFSPGEPAAESRMGTNRSAGV